MFIFANNMLHILHYNSNLHIWLICLHNFEDMGIICDNPDFLHSQHKQLQKA